MLTEPKFKRPVKTGNDWPGVTKLNFKHPGVQYPWKFHCPQPLCFYHIVAAAEEILVQRIETHQCPWFGGGTTTFSWGTMSDDYLTPIWLKLDAEMDIIKGDPANTNPDKKFAQQRASAYAETLAIFMPPFFTTRDEIAREAVVRWERRQAKLEYTTPGLGRFKFQRPPGVVGDPDNPSWVARAEYDASEPKPAPKHNLSDQDVTAIKASKGFPVNMLATAYNTTEAVTKYLQAN